MRALRRSPCVGTVAWRIVISVAVVSCDSSWVYACRFGRRGLAVLAVVIGVVVLLALVAAAVREILRRFGILSLLSFLSLLPSS